MVGRLSEEVVTEVTSAGGGGWAKVREVGQTLYLSHLDINWHASEEPSRG